MRILILATYYPPDTAVAAIRPYMLAKHLSGAGHDVTVLRSGEIKDGISSFYSNDNAVNVISYLGETSPAERYDRGETVAFNSLPKGRFSFIPKAIRRSLAKAYAAITRRKRFDRWLQDRQNRFQLQKKTLDAMKDAAFDVVFSTYGELENIFAGQYAAQLFHAPLIQDFRDPLANRVFHNRREYGILKQIQQDAVQKADACTAVSEGVLQEVCKDKQRAVVLYNGYEPLRESAVTAATEFRGLSFCYTGRLYGGMRDFTPLLKALKTLIDQNIIPLGMIRIHYAGKDFNYLQEQAEKHGMTETLVDHGYVGREEAAAMQEQADFFMVLSWNTKTAQGVLTGKFYEGIRAGKPILSLVSGEVPNSELYLINEKYHYGFCYENCRKAEHFTQLCRWLEQAYQNKMSGGKIPYTPDPALETDFRYDKLTQKLEALCLQLMEEKNKD